MAAAGGQFLGALFVVALGVSLLVAATLVIRDNLVKLQQRWRRRRLSREAIAEAETRREQDARWDRRGAAQLERDARAAEGLPDPESRGRMWAQIDQALGRSSIWEDQ